MLLRNEGLLHRRSRGYEIPLGGGGTRQAQQAQSKPIRLVKRGYRCEYSAVLRSYQQKENDGDEFRRNIQGRCVSATSCP